MTEKTLEAYNDVFADIVNGLLFCGEKVLLEDALTDAQPFSMYKEDGNIHEQERDIAKYWIDSHGEHANIRIAFFGVENQTKYDKDMALRVIGYDGAVYRSELSQKSRYPVITLVLYFGKEKWGQNHSLYDTIPVSDKFRPYVSDYTINVFEIAHLSEETVSHFSSDFKIVVDYFVHSRTDPDYRPKDPVKFRHVDELLKLMSALTQDQRFVETMQEEGGKPGDMCELLDRVEAKGIKLGLKQGIEQGIEQGIDANRLDNIKSLMKNLNLTAAQAMNILEIPSTDQIKYAGRL